jgi:hypothetical protein
MNLKLRPLVQLHQLAGPAPPARWSSSTSSLVQLHQLAGPAPPARWSSSTSPLVQLHQEHDPSGSLLPPLAPTIYTVPLSRLSLSLSCTPTYKLHV